MKIKNEDEEEDEEEEDEEKDEEEEAIMITIEEAVLAYGAAFNENDPAKRRQLIEFCFAEEGTITAFHAHLAGHEEVLAHIADFRITRPAERAIFTSGIDQHHNWFRFTGVVIRPDGSRYGDALDIGEVGPNGRIVRIISFHGPQPEVPANWPVELTKDPTST